VVIKVSGEAIEEKTVKNHTIISATGARVKGHKLGFMLNRWCEFF